MRNRLILIPLLCAAGFTPHLVAAELLWGATQSGSLFTIDPSTAAVTAVGNIAGTVSIIGLAVSNNHLYAFDSNSNNLLEIDANPADGAAVLNTYSLGISATGEGDIAFNGGGANFNGSGSLYLESSAFPTEKFYSATLTNATTGGSTLIKTCAVSPCPSGETRVFFDGLSFVGSTLYGLQQGGAGLYTISTSTGLPTLVGSTGLAGGNANGALTADLGNSQLFGDLSNNVGASLYTFALNGTPTLVGTLGSYTNVTGLAFVTTQQTTSSAPEPSTLMLLSGGLGLAFWRRRSRRQ